MSAPVAVPTTGPPATGAELVAIVPGVWAPGAPEAAVAWALSQIEDYCNRHFVKQTAHRIRLDAQGYEALLPDPPVLAVTRVEGYLRPFGAIAAAWSDLTNYDWTPSGRLYDTSMCRSVRGWSPTWPDLPEGLRVTYDHGFDAWPPAVVSAVKHLGAMFLVNPTGMSEQRTAETLRRWLTGGATVGGTTTSGLGAGGIGTAAALDRLVLLEVD